jgi:two-component system chemotaxis response regulator CheB
MAPSHFSAVVIGTSAGGTQVLTQILPGLPANFPLPVIIVQHLHPLQSGASLIYAGCGSALKLKDADEKEVLRAGFVYFAVPNYHLLIEADHSLSFSIDPRVHFTRPAVDVLFESAAYVYGASLIGIVLSGLNQDGAAGLRRIKQRGGLTIVQDPAEAEFNAMPLAAIDAATPAHILKADGILHLLISLTTPAPRA